ncbi:MAG: PepSY domain-containing protein [Bacteroidaceae bacterium]|nr:PepSY domain-containing protein [Bacteroidaceae bacterium]
MPSLINYRKLFKQIHLYLSLPFGIVITLICFSGAMLALEDDIAPSAGRHLQYVEPTSASLLSLDELMKQTQATLSEDVKITGVTIFADSLRSYQFSLSKPKKASIYVNPYTGEVLGNPERTPFFTTMFKMHRWLLGPSKAEDGSIGWGKLLVGVSTLLFVFILISGLIIWWPKSWRTFRASLKIPVSRGLHSFLHGLHLSGGALTLIFLIIMATTGLTWSFAWYKDGFYALFGAPSSPTPALTSSVQEKGEKGKSKKEDTFAWQQALDNVKQQVANFQQLTLSPNSASVRTDVWGNTRATDQYVLNASGEVTAFTPYAETPHSRKLSGWIFTLHTGAFAGAWGKWLWALVALIGATLPLTGYYLWWKRIRPKAKHQREPQK